MTPAIFINIPVTDLARSVSFYTAVGATRNPMFSDDTAACMVLSEAISVMLLTHAKFSGFTSRKIPDAHQTAQFMLAMAKDDRAAVDTIVGKAAAAGGKADPNPVQDLGFMYGRSYADPDGHIWEVFWMDPAAMASGASDK